MKKLLLLSLLITGFCLTLFCQDILVLKNGDEIKVKVSEVLPDMVKYKKWDNQNGPIYSELKGNIFMIKYQNGSKDVFANQGASNSNSSPVSNEETMKNEAIKELEASIVADLQRRQKDRIIKVAGIQKTNGVMKNLGGQSIYTIYFDMTLEFIADGWLVGNMFEGYWQGLNVYPSQPNLAGSGQPYTAKKYPRGTVVILECVADMSKTDNGYKAGNLDIKNEKSVVQRVSTGNNNSQNQTNSNKPISNSTIANMINGNWYGNAFQNGVKKPFSIEFSCDLQKNEFKVNYPSVGCSGIWNIERSSDISIDFREHILTGRTACVEGGLVRLIFVNSNKLEG